MSATVGFAGMTHLGLVSANAVASKGFTTVCYDANKELIANLVAGKLPVLEPDLPELLASNGSRQTFSSDLAALGACDVIYIAPDVPTDDEGQSDLGGIRSLIDAVAGVLKADAVMVVLCQVPPGFTRSLKAPPLPRRYYQVETLVFGRAVERATEPERYIVGCADPEKPLDPRFADVLGAFGCPILPALESANWPIRSTCAWCWSASPHAGRAAGLGAVWSEIALASPIAVNTASVPGLARRGGTPERDQATLSGSRPAWHRRRRGAWRANSRTPRLAVRTIRRHCLTNPTNCAVWGLAQGNTTGEEPAVVGHHRATAGDTAPCLHDPVVPASRRTPGRGRRSSQTPGRRRADDPHPVAATPRYWLADTPACSARSCRPYAVLEVGRRAGGRANYHTLGRPRQPEPKATAPHRNDKPTRRGASRSSAQRSSVAR